MRSRHGFTLIELLVATGVFMIGFSACFGLFLAGMRYRTLAEDTTRMSLAASSLVEELAIGNPTATSGLKPRDYVGSGQLPVVTSTTDSSTLTPYPGVPGTWYSVESCTDVLGDADNDKSPTLHLNLIVLVDTQSDASTGLDLKQIYRRMRLDYLGLTSSELDTLAQPTAQSLRTRVYDEIIKRGRAMRVSTVVVRRPSWM